MIAMFAYGISLSGAEAAGTVRDSNRDAGAAGTATMTASATRYSGSAAEPMVSRQPASVRVSSRTMALTRTSAFEALATASGRAPIPVVSDTNSGAGFLLLSQAGLSRAGLSRAGLSRAGLSRAGLSRSGLSRAGLSRAGLSVAGLSGAGLSGVGLSGAADSSEVTAS